MKSITFLSGGDLISSMLDRSDKKFLAKNVPLAAFIAGLCCFSPVVLVLLGLSTTAFAASLANTLYGTYKWVFRSAGLLLLLASLAWYFYKKENICSIDQAKRKKNKIINVTLMALIIAVLGYVIWLYVIVEYLGIWLGLWA